MTQSTRYLPRNSAFACALVVLVWLYTISPYAAPLQTNTGTGPAYLASSSQRLFSPAGVDTTHLPADTITINTVWDIVGSPYLVEGDLVVAAAAALTIDPGVEVIFADSCQLIVYGKLTAVGVVADTLVDSIRFTAANPNVGWGGLRLINAQILSRLEYCEFSYGNAQGSWPNDRGGAIYIYGSIQAIKHCSFIKNKASQEGGSIYLWGATPEFAYNKFWGNSSGSGYGHSLYLGNCSGLLLNHLTITGNGPTNSGWSLYTPMGDSLSMQNSILWDSFKFATRSGNVNHCDIDTTTAVLLAWGVGNINNNPQFVDSAAGDLELKLYSPCIDRAAISSPVGSEPPPNGGIANMGYDGGSSAATQSLPLMRMKGLSGTARPDTLNTVITPINFGTRKKFVPDTLYLYMYNIGRAVDIIDSITISDPQFTCNFDSLKNKSTGKLTIGADSSKVLTLIFKPTLIDSAEATVHFYDIDTLYDPIVTLQGVGNFPVISIDSLSINFKTESDLLSTSVGDTLRARITIKNTGTDSVGIQSKLFFWYSQVTNFLLLHDGSTGAFNKTLLVGESDIDTVLFVPTVAGDSLYANLIFNFVDSSGVADDSLFCYGSAKSPTLYYDPTSLAFGVMPKDSTKTDTFQVKNNGDGNLVLRSFGWQQTSVVNFSFASTAQDTVLPHDSLYVLINFKPQMTGPITDIAKIKTNINANLPAYPDSCVYITVNVSGTGTSFSNYWIGDTSGVWSKENSPYFVVGDLNVPAGKTLRIEDSVEVRFEGNFEISVSGALIAQGTATDSISFQPLNLTTGAWKGVTIKSGASDSTLFQYCKFQKGVGKELLPGTTVGGAMRVEDAAPLIEYCTFYDNNADSGGALALLGGSRAIVRNCVFRNDTARYGGAIYGAWFANSQLISDTLNFNQADSTGGAIYFAGSMGVISECDISANRSKKFGGAITLGDGAAPVMSGNKIHNNRAKYGGGVAMLWQSKPYIHDEWVVNNTADSTGGGYLIQDGSTPLIQKTLIAENIARLGKAIHTLASGSVINNCTMVGVPEDTATTKNAANQDTFITWFPVGWLLKADAGDNSVITNSILGAQDSLGWIGTTQSAISNLGSDIAITYSDVADTLGILYTGQGNRNQYPGFLGTGDVYTRYTLAEYSPANEWSESNNVIGFEGGSSSPLIWNTTLSLLQNPVQLNSFVFLITSTIPLSAPPYLYITQDLADTLGVLYVPIDSAAMVQIAPLIYQYAYFLDVLDSPARVTFTMKNVLNNYRTYEVTNIIGRLYGEPTSLSLDGRITAQTRSQSGEGIWMIMSDSYGEPKPLSIQQIGLGDIYLISASLPEIIDGRLEFHLTSEILGNFTAEGCAIGRWNGSDWEVLPSYLTSDQTTVWSSLTETGSYRLLWGENLRAILLPTDVILEQNYPNPFNPETVISFALPDAGKVILDVFDLTGRKVITLFDGHVQPGYHKVSWSGRNTYGESVASGIYFYRLRADQKIYIHKMILLR